MALTAKLEFRQSQQLVMTPQLQQAIKLLQLSNLELTEFVETELERNPLLERDVAADGPVARDERADPEAPATAEPADWLDIGKGTADPQSTFDTEVENVFPDTSATDLGPDLVGSWSGVRSRDGASAGEDVNYEAMLSSETSLKDHLTAQVPLVLTAPADRLIGQYLVDNVDDAGYLVCDLDDLALKLGATPEMIDGVLARLQTLDPPGVFARSLAECLALQLKEKNRFDPVIAALLDNLPLLASHDFARLKKAVGVDMDELKDMILEIKQLNPKPGLRFGSEQVQTVVPDVLVRAAADGSWLVELNSETLPRVLVNRSYYTRVAKTARAPGDRDYLLDCLQTANWLAKSLDQRARTILKVAEEIVRQQDGFFTYGVQHLRPLNLKTVAEAISMHESTVSRVTSNKYVATPRGIFEMKYFFTSAIASSEDGEAHSSESVRHRIRQLIDGEKPRSILSDDRIVELLRGEGVDIARRTVAKYREAMRIPSSVQRRREKQLADHRERETA